jgi:chemotaxis protein CheZ
MADISFERRLAELKAERGERIPVEEIAEVVEQLLGSLEGDLTGLDLRLYRELERLAAYINRAKEEISELCPAELRHDELPAAADQLDAIVTHTEEATTQILDNAEAIDRLAGEIDPKLRDSMRASVTRIYEACNFQDITGQRITKVVKTLKHIEEELDKLLQVFGIEAPAQPKRVKGPLETAQGRELLNGPQLPDEANRQAEIDALLANFD